MKLPTIYDVAHRAGVSVATVSRVLNQPSRVNIDKRKKVLDAISELNFVPKADAVANARKQYNKVGVIAPFFTQPSFMQRLRGISSVLGGQHYELVIYAIESSKELEEYIDMLCSSKRVDGLIVLSLNLNESSLKSLGESGIPVCFVETEFPGFDSVIVENYLGGKLAAELLYQRGFRNPGFIGDASLRDFAIPATEHRLRGFIDYFNSKGIDIPKENILIEEFENNSTITSINRFFESSSRPDSFFTSSDIIAIKTKKIAYEYGFIPPKDFGLVGFDDLDIAEHLNLSTICQSLDETGRLAAQMVIDRISDPHRATRKVVAPLEVKNRD